VLYYAERTSYGCGVCPSHAINASKLITAGSSVCGHRIATGLQLLTLNRLQQIQNSFAVVKTARSTHGIPVLEVIVEHIEYKLPSVTYRVLTTTYYYHATYLSSQRDIYSTHSQYPILICCHLARPPTVSSSKTTDRSLTYMHHLVFGINFTYSFRHLHQFRHDSLPRDVKSYLSSSPLSASITPLFFHSRFKSSLFQNSSHHNRPTLYPRKKPQPCAFRDKIAKSQPI